MGARRIDFIQLRGDGQSLVNAAAQETRRLLVKLAQVGERFGIAGIQPDRLFKLFPHTLGKRIGGKKRGPAGLLSQGAAQPEAIVGVSAVEAHRLFALVDGGIPLLQGEADAALQVVALGLRGGGWGKRAEDCQCAVRLAGLESRIGLSQRSLRGNGNGHRGRQ